MINRLMLFVFLFCAFSASAQTTYSVPMQHPSWIMQGNIYEVNTRQYTPEGTFKAFQKHLPRLKAMGVQTLWFMPIHPISLTDRKGTLGSYYAVADFTAVNPEFGSLNDWKNLVKAAHSMGMKVIIDWVPNHSGADNKWLTTHPQFYSKNDKGELIAPFDWTDVRKLNYHNREMADSMIASMQFWVKETGIDGFRCDVAAEVPQFFWERCIAELKKTKPDIFMLAEGNESWLHLAGFNATYPWEMFHKMIQVRKGLTPAYALDSVLRKIDQTYPSGSLQMYFTSNHDENSWNKADYETMPGGSHAPFAVLTQTLHSAIPLIYSGQEEPYLDSLSFFYKDTIQFKHFKRAHFYTTLLALRKSNEALAADAAFKKLSTTNDEAIYAFERMKNGKNVLVITNLSDKPQSYLFVTAPAAGNRYNIFTKQTEKPKLNLQPWEYLVYELR